VKVCSCCAMLDLTVVYSVLGYTFKCLPNLVRSLFGLDYEINQIIRFGDN